MTYATAPSKFGFILGRVIIVLFIGGAMFAGAMLGHQLDTSPSDFLLDVPMGMAAVGGGIATLIARYGLLALNKRI